jgi:endonuclease/exonuclease/phosphatase family metal-dependent hydrolase
MKRMSNKQKFLSAPLLFIIFILSAPCLHGQSVERDTLSFMEWNVENLFDFRHDTLKDDVEFLPESMRHWTYHRYRNKLDQIAKVIAAVGEWNAPALVALCEVENDSVLIALTRYSALREMDYRYVMTDSPDQRGIDVALLYQRDRFRLLSHESIRIPPLGHFKPTRDILHVTGEVVSGDTLDIFVVHAPSRAGGMLESEPYRLHCMSVLKGVIDKLMDERQTARFIVTGDFNDFPTNRSVCEVLRAKAPDNIIDSRRLYHLLARRIAKTHEGTYKYRGEWNLLDHFIVSGKLLDENESTYTDESLTDIIAFSFLCTDDTTYSGWRPFRTFFGMKYEGGFSDHLPLRMKIVVKR